MLAREILTLGKEAFQEWSDDKASRLAAAMAYYTVLSLAPLLIVLIFVAGRALGDEAAQNQIVGQIGGIVGPQAAEIIQQMVLNASRPTGGLVATLVGSVTLVFGALGLFNALQGTLNTIWEVEPEPGRGILSVVLRYAFLLLLVAVVAILVLALLVATSVVAGLTDRLAEILPLGSTVVWVLNVVLSLAVATLLFALLFKFVPMAQVAWRDVWLGAFVTSVLFVVGQFALSFYLGRGSITSAYGAAGSLVALLLWVYYTAQILFFGAEFTQVYANRYGSKLKPEEEAVAVREGPEAPPAEKGGEAAGEDRARVAQSEPQAGERRRKPATRERRVGEGQAERPEQRRTREGLGGLRPLPGPIVVVLAVVVAVLQAFRARQSS